MFWASAGREIPAAAAAAAAAWAFRTVRRVRSMDLLPLLDRLEMVKDEGGGEHAVEKLDRVDPFDDLAFRLRLEGDDQFADILAAMDFGSRDRTDALHDEGHAVGTAVNHEAGDVTFAGHAMASRAETRMASAGQDRAQAPQPVQASARIAGRAPPTASSNRTASTGQASRQLM